jgi:hypothetical protein
MDLSWIATWFDSVNTFFQAVWDFMDSGIYDFIKSMLVVVTKSLIYTYIEFKVYMVEIAYDVVKEILQDTGVSEMVKSAWASIPGDMQAMLGFFNIPQGLTLIFSAIPTKWALKFVPGATS